MRIHDPTTFCLTKFYRRMTSSLPHPQTHPKRIHQKQGVLFPEKKGGTEEPARKKRKKDRKETLLPQEGESEQDVSMDDEDDKSSSGGEKLADFETGVAAKAAPPAPKKFEFNPNYNPFKKQAVVETAPVPGSVFNPNAGVSSGLFGPPLLPKAAAAKPVQKAAAKTVQKAKTAPNASGKAARTSNKFISSRSDEDLPSSPRVVPPKRSKKHPSTPCSREEAPLRSGGDPLAPVLDGSRSRMAWLGSSWKFSERENELLYTILRDQTRLFKNKPADYAHWHDSRREEIKSFRKAYANRIKKNREEREKVSGVGGVGAVAGGRVGAAEDEELEQLLEEEEEEFAGGAGAATSGGAAASSAAADLEL